MPNLIGLNVTTPYKEKVISFLDELDEEAKKIGAVNCILISRKDGNLKLKGFNTDLFGFRQSIKPFLESQHERALILGSGGAAKAVKYTLEKIGVPCWIVSRKNNRTPGENFFQYEELNENILRQFKLIVNASPVGTFPNSEEFPQLPYDGIEAGHLLYDLVYNPSETVFLKKGKERNAVCMNGLSMLYHQADEAFRIWQTGINQGL
jgi:shikimate dehydrogenase